MPGLLSHTKLGLRSSSFSYFPTHNKLRRSMATAISPNLTKLKHWSCWGKDQKELPPVSQIKAIHIYDFDNTLFLSALPNTKLWTTHSSGFLKMQDAFAGGGWFHDKRLLQATGKGMAWEEPRAWQGNWNEDIVKLAELSIRQEDALTVLLTGRLEDRFADIIKRMVKSRKLEFDMLCLKPTVAAHTGKPFQSTGIFKQALIRDLVANYQEIDELTMYEDRPKHTEMFTRFLNDVNLELIRGEFPGNRRTGFAAEVVQVPHRSIPLDPVTECAEVQSMINDHNATNPNTRLQIKRTVFFTGYLLNQSDADKLVSLLEPSLLKGPDIKVLANNIMITPKPATESVLQKVGGLGAKQIWQVTAVGNWNGAVYGAKVNPIPSSAVVSVESSTPMVVLATLRGAKAIESQRIATWQPVATEKQFVFETTVGEKVQLRIEAETEGESEYDSLFPKPYGYNNSSVPQKRRAGPDDNGAGRDDRRISGSFRGGRGGRGDRDRDRNDRRERHRDRDSGTRGGRGAGGVGRDSRNDHRIHRKQQRGGHAYRSLDDMPNGSNGANGAPSYRGDNNHGETYQNARHGEHVRDAGRQAPHDAADRYNTNFPPLGSGPPKPIGGYDGTDSGGLHY